MHIVFQFGEFIGEEDSKTADFIIQMLSALIGAGSAIFVFYLGLKQQRKKDLSQKLDLINEKLRYIDFLFNGSYADTVKQVNSIEQFIAEQKKNYSKLVLYNIIIKNNVERIVNNVNQEEHFLAYVHIFNDDNVTKLFDLCDYYNRALNKVYEDLKSNARYDYELKIEFKSLIDQSVNKIASYLFKLKQNINYQKDDLYNLLNEGIVHYYEVLELGVDDFLAIRENFINPLLPHLLNYRNVNEIYEIAELLSKANKSLTPVLLNKQKLVENLEKTKNDLESQLKKFTHFIKPLDDYLLKYNLKITRLEIK